MKNYEVLAPVGSFKEINIILDEKPDAIYVGMKGLTSRPSRTDFTVEEIKEAVDLCRAKGVQIYVAVNSNVPSESFDDLVDMLLDLDDYGVDAFILADYGLIRVLSKRIRYAEIHASEYGCKENHILCKFIFR